MDPRVRDLYKRFMLAGRGYPQGLSYIREKAKAAFFANRALPPGGVEAKRAIAKGRYWVREVVAVNQLHKYRSMRRSYFADKDG